ncbi:PQQ-binding-like beta-propeller repeat protein [Halomicroarcula sp. GCM10025324]|uniref:PQQ-binding-like beta-propeller repeat protein n=1 Tax=Haloarcula TaxID=2237 RepID=UPI0023E8D886|nr:PQQ-binding-like beta-propeller repeat protein [Halomicroarcula sp. ZS-22-S1]
MVSRRHYLRVAGLALASVAGCARLGERDGTATDGPSGSPTETDRETTSRTDRPTAKETDTSESDGSRAWEPTWSFDVEFGNVLALTADGTDLYATLSDDAGRSAVARVDRAGQRLAWETEFPGEVVTSTHLRQTNARDKWSLTVADGALYVLTGNIAEDDAWTALHALDSETGQERWSVPRERELAVAGVRDGTVVVGGLEFFFPDSTHEPTEEPLTTVLYGIDAASGDVRWTREFTAVQAATTATDGLAVASASGVTALDLDGGERWSESTGTARTVVAVGDSTVAALADGDGSSLRAFGPEGTERWQDRRPVEEFLVDGDVLYGLGEETVAVEADGTVAWQVDGYSQWPLLAPDGDTLYTRAAVGADAVDAFSLPEGGRRFRYETPSNNGWPAGATDSFVVAEAITPEEADFTSLFAVDERSGEPMAVFRPADTVFDVAGVGDTAYAGIGGRLLAFEGPG